MEEGIMTGDLLMFTEKYFFYKKINQGRLYRRYRRNNINYHQKRFFYLPPFFAGKALFFFDF
jgi:hypothetical protein